MTMKLMRVALFFAGALAIAGCQMDGAKTVAPSKKPAAADYQLASSPSGTANKAICYADADLAVIRGRMLQQEFAVAALACQTAGGGRAYEPLYSSFLSKFNGNGELPANTRALQQLSGRKRFNIDVLVTEFANRTAQMPPADKAAAMPDCAAMMQQHDAMQKHMAEMNTKLQTLVDDMNKAKGAAKSDKMAAVINELVAQRTMMQQQMMDMHPKMMEHMMEHMKSGMMKGMADSMGSCAMMKGGDKTPAPAAAPEHKH